MGKINGFIHDYFAGGKNEDDADDNSKHIMNDMRPFVVEVVFYFFKKSAAFVYSIKQHDIGDNQKQGFIRGDFFVGYHKCRSGDYQQSKKYVFIA